jgi:endonuclease/exonuclease/phosphatase family metal-dependent hydrolase
MTHFLPQPPTITHRDIGLTRVVSYNVHGETYGWGPDQFLPYDYTNELEKLDADIYVIPELWAPHNEQDGAEENGSFIVRWAEKTGHNIYTARASHSSPRKAKLRHEGDAHIAIVTKLEADQLQTFTFPNHRKDTSNDRNCVAALLKTENNGSLWVLAVHFSANVPHVPISNLKALQHFIAELEKTGHPVIVAGDFNLWGWWIRTIQRGPYRRAVRGRTWPAHKPHSQIDHIMFAKDIAVHHAAVLPAGHSDHRPVFADIKRVNWATAAPYKLEH